MQQKYCLTFDIDWAPDFAIRHCLDTLDEFGVSACFFVTHATPLNPEAQSRGHSLGIHPNFLPNSTHGTDTIEIIRECLSYAPDASCMRTHALVQSTPLLHEVFSNFPQLRLDVSLLMHRSPFAHKCEWEFGSTTFERLLYNWEDDAEFPGQRFGNEDDLFFGDLTVCDFHPIHVLLNSSDGSEYAQLKKVLQGRALHSLSADEIVQFKNPGIGVETHLRAILSSDATSVGLEEI